MDFLPTMKQNISEEQAQWLNPLVLALVGDSVQTLYERTKIAVMRDTKVGVVHSAVAKKVNATSQAALAHTLESTLTEQELAIFKRARNHNAHKAPKNANVGDYRIASGIEAVFGYLYLTGAYDRLKDLLAQA